MDHSLHERLADALRGVSSAKRHIESAGVAVKICKAPGHAGEDMEIFGIEKAAFRRAVGSDNLDAAFEREDQNARVSVSAADDRNCVLAPGVRQQRQIGLGHAFPKACEATVVAMDVLAVGQAFHHDGPGANRAPATSSRCRSSRFQQHERACQRVSAPRVARPVAAVASS